MVTTELIIQTLVMLPAVVLSLLGLIVAIAMQERFPKVAPYVVLAEAINLVTCVAWFVFRAWSQQVWGYTAYTTHAGVTSLVSIMVQVVSLAWPLLLGYAALAGRSRQDLDQ